MSRSPLEAADRQRHPGPSDNYEGRDWPLGARAVQHETDHIDGVMFTDRMSESDQREVSSVLSDFEMHFRRQQQLGKYPSDEQIREELRRLEPK